MAIQPALCALVRQDAHMFSKKSAVALFLALTLLAAPAALAGPASNAGLGWMSYASAAFDQVVAFFHFDRNATSTDQQSTPKPTVSNVCGEMGSTHDPGGCPG